MSHDQAQAARSAARAAFLLQLGPLDEDLLTTVIFDLALALSCARSLDGDRAAARIVRAELLEEMRLRGMDPP